jgi:hypothetical protein
MSGFNLTAICSGFCAAGSVDARGDFSRAALNPATQIMSPSLGSDLKI